MKIDACCVTNITLSHSALATKFVDLIQMFPNLENLDLSSCGLKSLDGINRLPRLTCELLQF